MNCRFYFSYTDRKERGAREGLNVTRGELMKKGSILILLVMGGPIMAITVSNRSEFAVYGATYYMRKEAERVGEIAVIEPGEKVRFDRPGLASLKRRTFVFSLNKEDLKDMLTSSEYHLLPHFPIGYGNRFYIALSGGSLKGYNYAQWKVLAPLRQQVSGVTSKLDEVTLGRLRKRYLGSTPSLGQQRVVTVRKSTSLPRQEEEFLAKRRAHIRPALEEWLGMRITDQEVPVIALAGSGGGYRAMLGYVGALIGAEDSGVLDVLSYTASLSGSTWALGPWVSSGWSLDEFKEVLLEKIETDITRFSPDMPALLNELLMRMSFRQPLTVVNLYGWILGQNLMADFPKGPHHTYMHDQASRIQDGSRPMPIYTAVATKLPYQWVEFTPWEVGGDYFGGYIPIWAFGAPFLDGAMRYFTPPYSLSFILAICGSAFAARLARITKEIEEKIPFGPVRNALSIGMEETAVGKHRVSAARVFNWTWGMRPLPRAQQEIIKLIDAGIAYNVPLEPLYRRKADIILVTDFSAGEPAGELRKAERELKAQGYKVPKISYEGIMQRPFTVFKDEDDPSTPVIIYFPHVGNPGYSTFDPKECMGSWCSTFNFTYLRHQAEQLIGLSKHAIKGAADDIRDEIRQWIEARRS